MALRKTVFDDREWRVAPRGFLDPSLQLRQQQQQQRRPVRAGEPAASLAWYLEEQDEEEDLEKDNVRHRKDIAIQERGKVTIRLNNPAATTGNGSDQKPGGQGGAAGAEAAADGTVVAMKTE